MAHRIKCKGCNGCLSALWVKNSRYYYCGFCKIWYGGREVQQVPSPYQEEIDSASNRVEDPVFEEDYEGKQES